MREEGLKAKVFSSGPLGHQSMSLRSNTHKAKHVLEFSYTDGTSTHFGLEGGAGAPPTVGGGSNVRLPPLTLSHFTYHSLLLLCDCPPIPTRSARHVHCSPCKLRPGSSPVGP